VQQQQSINISSDNASCPPDIHRSYNRERDKTPSTVLGIKSALAFMYANRPVSDVMSPHLTDNLPTSSSCSKGTDAVQRSLSPQHLADSFNFDHVQDINHTPPALRSVNNSPDAFDYTHTLSTWVVSWLDTFPTDVHRTGTPSDGPQTPNSCKASPDTSLPASLAPQQPRVSTTLATTDNKCNRSPPIMGFGWGNSLSRYLEAAPSQAWA
jgi:hypothetical protein